MGSLFKSILGIALVLVSLVLIVKLVAKVRINTALRRQAKILEEQKKKFQVGVVLRPYALTVKTPIPEKWADPKKTIEQEISFAKELAVSHLRANLEKEEDLNDYIVEKTAEEGFLLTLIIDPEFKGDFYKTATYDLGYKLGKEIASRYQEKIPFYQLANEASGVTIKKGFPGYDESHYDAQKYKVFKDWVKGLSEGVKAGDPKAKRIISANWQGTAVLEMLERDGVEFEIIGWNWFSDMGDIFNQEYEGKSHNIPKEISQKLKKDFWIVESNFQGGSFKGKEKEQAEYLAKFIEEVRKSPDVKGLFIFTLTDIAEINNKSEGNLGLVKVKENPDGTWSFAAKKPAFEALKKAIKELKG